MKTSEPSIFPFSKAAQDCHEIRKKRLKLREPQNDSNITQIADTEMKSSLRNDDVLVSSLQKSAKAGVRGEGLLFLDDLNVASEEVIESRRS